MFDNLIPYTNIHEMNLDWIIKKVKELSNDVDDVKNFINTLTDEIIPPLVKEEVDRLLTSEDIIAYLEEIVASGIPHSNATYHVDIYVNCQVGSDDNTGLTNTDPVLTFDKAMDIMNRKSSGAYIHLQAPGNYIMSYPVVSGAMLHVLFEAANINLYWLDVTDDAWTKCFYSCYINLSGYDDGTSIFYLRGSRNAYIESGKLFLKNMIIDSDPTIGLGILGATLQSEGCVYKTPLYASGSNVISANDTFNVETNTSQDSIIHAYNSTNVTLRDVITFENIDNNANINKLIDMNATELFLLNMPTLINTTKVKIFARSSSIHGSVSRINAWLDSCDLLYIKINDVFIQESINTYTCGYELINQDVPRGTRFNVGTNIKNLIVIPYMVDGNDNIVIRFTPNIIPYNNVISGQTLDFYTNPVFYNGSEYYADITLFSTYGDFRYTNNRIIDSNFAVTNNSNLFKLALYVERGY